MENEFERVVVAAEYVTHHRQLKIALSDGSEHFIPIDRLQMERWNGSSIEALPRPDDFQLETVKVWGGGGSILFPEIEQVFLAEDLVAGRYGDSKWMTEIAADAVPVD
ncbi:hypothetical protein [cf. Phormidesmis sp. LEGE 11477]|uniref:hypothetical protein n=1 Tax=cf. Phormidesmis sp. LEGE 11477 TaxID=1828680 RepID=UPI00187E71C7|nr:hypothetical protein [cf. Phormidesmis sp. LEGE 11477]MBE9059479.1 hypothetical protein [cf. Phormidesmis sp. LEGE 11477]